MNAVRTEPPPFELSKVQLGDHLDIDPATLAGGGPGLWELVGTDRDLDVRTPQENLDALPVTGWRRVHLRPASDNFGRSEMLAAPYPELSNAWAVVSLGERDGKWLLSTDPGPLPVYPGRAKRRESLRSTWPTGLSAPAGTVPELHMVLTNVSAHEWINVTGERAYVRAWLLDEHRHRIGSPGFAYSASDATALPDLGPGMSTTLPPTWPRHRSRPTQLARTPSMRSSSDSTSPARPASSQSPDPNARCCRRS